MDQQSAFRVAFRDVHRVWFQQTSPSRTLGLVRVSSEHYARWKQLSPIMRAYLAALIIPADLLARLYQEARWQMALSRFRKS
jgi:hypothetical protein